MSKLLALIFKEMEKNTSIHYKVAADRGNISHSTAAAIMNGKGNPRFSTIVKFYYGFGFPPQKFLSSEILARVDINALLDELEEI